MHVVGVKCMKVFFLLFNAMVLVAGIALIATGVYIRPQMLDYSVFLDAPMFKMAPIILIVIGAIIAFIACLGLYGTCADNRMIVIIYGLLLLIIFILEVAAGLAGFIFSTEVRKVLSNYLRTTTNNYVGWSITQSLFNCCGVNGPIDWLELSNNTVTNSTDTNSTDTNSTYTYSSLPLSCCASTSNECNVTTSYSQGCLEKLEIFLKNEINSIGADGFTLAFVQLVGIILAFYVAKAFKEEEYEAISNRFLSVQHLHNEYTEDDRTRNHGLNTAEETSNLGREGMGREGWYGTEGEGTG